MEKEKAKMVKSKSTPKNGSNKFRATVTISPELHRRVKESGLNLSRFTENSLIWLFSQIDSGDIRLIDGNNVILDLDSENSGKNTWTRRDSNTRPPPCQGVSNLGFDLETEAGNEFLENSKTSRKMALGAFMEDDETRAAYMSFAAKTGVSAHTTKDYVSALRMLDDVYTPADLYDYKDSHARALGDKQRKGLLKLFKFLETKRMIQELNGYPLSVWRSNLTVAEKGESNMAGRVKDLTDAEVRAARDRIENLEVRDYYTLLAYSGARHKHLHAALKERRPIHRIGKDVIYIDVSDLSAGKKLESRFYFPAAAESTLREIEITHGYAYYREIISAAGTASRPINAASLRKWQYSLMLTGEPNISAMAADQIQGRTPKTVGAAHYANLDKIAEEGYVKVAAKIQAALPVEA